MKLKKYFITKRPPIEWMIDAEIDYTGARCLLLNNILEPGLFLACRTIEKYLKTFISFKTSHIPLTHELEELLRIIKEKDPFEINSELEFVIDFFDSIKNNVNYIDSPDLTKKIRSACSYGKCDIVKLDQVAYEFEKTLWNNEIIRGYTYPKTNIATIKEVIQFSNLPKGSVICIKEKWLLANNNYFKKH
jgi:HEPN domain-containing protein